MRDRLNKLLEELKNRGFGQNQQGKPGQQGQGQGDMNRKGAQGLAQSMQQQMGQGPGPGRSGRLGQPRAQQDTDPLAVRRAGANTATTTR